jgi:hypothetical protein
MLTTGNVPERLLVHFTFLNEITVCSQESENFSGELTVVRCSERMPRLRRGFPRDAFPMPFDY